MRTLKSRQLLLFALVVGLLTITLPCSARADLNEVKERGVLRHLGVTYAHFVHEAPDGGYDGLDVEMMQLFAEYLGVKYQFVSTTWPNLFTDLTGRKLNAATHGYNPEVTQEIKGDIIANGLTVLPNRKKVVNYSLPTFPTGVWLIAPANSTLAPITPSGNMKKDVTNVIASLTNHSVLTMSNTCLDASYFNFDPSKISIKYFTSGKTIDEIVPAMLKGAADTTLLDIPDALILLEKMAGDIKIIGPVSDFQFMGTAVGKNSPELLKAFNLFFKQIWNDGTYRSLVKKYYPSVFLYLGDFFGKTY